MFKKGNAYAALLVIVIIVILFISYWAMMPVFGSIYDTFMNDEDFNDRFDNEADCRSNGGSWTGTECNQLDSRAKDLLQKERRIWLIAPFILVFGLILWYWTQITKKDYGQYGGP